MSDPLLWRRSMTALSPLAGTADVAFQVRCLAFVAEVHRVHRSGGQLRDVSIAALKRSASDNQWPSSASSAVAAQVILAAAYILDAQFHQADSILASVEAVEPELEPLLQLLNARSRRLNPRAKVSHGRVFPGRGDV